LVVDGCCRRLKQRAAVSKTVRTRVESWGDRGMSVATSSWRRVRKCGTVRLSNSRSRA
jgi:hypothetical protein